MLKKLNWQAYSGNDRNKTIGEIKEVISKSDAYIVNFNMFSDLALSLSVEIEENKIGDLHKTLSAILTVSDFDSKNVNLGSKKEWLIFINVSFSNGKGELKIEQPSVPG